jgi:hypothetical protein
VVSETSAPTWNFAVGGSYDSHLAINVGSQSTFYQPANAGLTNVANETVIRIGQVDVRTNLNVSQIVSTNGIGYVNSTIAGAGGALTNFISQATAGVAYLNGGTTNVNLTIEPGVSGLTYFPTFIISNLTTTARTLSLSATGNVWYGLQGYDSVTAPITITNKHTGILSAMINGTNVNWAWKVRTNGF